MMDYNSFRISFQSSEQAARVAYRQYEIAVKEREQLRKRCIELNQRLQCLNTTCKVRQYSDQILCECGLTWDVNDPDPPHCRRWVSRPTVDQ